MQPEQLRIYNKPELNNPRILLGFSGWMDGGEVSTGTIKYLIEKLDAKKFAEIDPEGFYIHNLPGPMEVTALFRPHVRIEDGLITSYKTTSNTFFYSEKNDLILFLGAEPNLNWQSFADCIFTICSEFDAKMIYFIGSVAGLVPHTRDPRILCLVSDAHLKKDLEAYGVKFSNYEGPSSIVTYLTANSKQKGLSMASLIAAIPAYVQGHNPKCIEWATRCLAGLLGFKVDFDALRSVSNKFEKKLTELIQQQPELEESIQKLESDYDDEIFDTEMGDLKNWLEQKGIRLD